MTNEKFDAWCREATKGIRYGPDREAVYRELMDHLEERRDSLLAEGLSSTQTTASALESMGSAQEIAPQLAAVHRPFWGYLEFTTRCIAFFMFFILLNVAYFALLSISPNFFDEKKENPYDDFSYYWESPYKVPYLDLEPNVSTGSDGYTLTATRFGAWYWSDHPEVGELCVRLTIQDHTPWEERYGFINYIWAEDSLGNRYRSEAEWMPKTKNVQIYNTQRDLFATSFDLMIWDLPVQDLQWIKICYTRDGRDMVIHIDLPGGGTQ